MLQEWFWWLAAVGFWRHSCAVYIGELFLLQSWCFLFQSAEQISICITASEGEKQPLGLLGTLYAERIINTSSVIFIISLHKHPWACMIESRVLNLPWTIIYSCFVPVWVIYCILSVLLFLKEDFNLLHRVVFHFFPSGFKCSLTKVEAVVCLVASVSLGRADVPWVSV